MLGKDIDRLGFPNIGNSVYYDKEFSVGAMLPQTPVSGPIIRKDSSTELYDIDDSDEPIEIDF